MVRGIFDILRKRKTLSMLACIHQMQIIIDPTVFCEICTSLGVSHFKQET